jgi:uncharacterized protein involved in exopolysaccharide biosynthesis
MVSGNLSLLDYGAIVWRRKVLVLLIIVGMAVPAAAASSLQQPSYLATAQIVLAQQQLDSNYNLEVQELSASQMDTQIAVIKSDAVADRARAKGVTVGVDAVSTSDSNLVRVSSFASDPGRAADAANAYVDAYQEITAEGASKTLDDAEQQLKTRMTLLQQQIDPLVRQVRDANAADRANAQNSVGALVSGLQQQQASLQAQVGRIDVQRALSNSSTIVHRAVPPNTAAGPKPLQDGALAAVLGLLIGVSVSVLLELRRRSTTAPQTSSTPTADPGWNHLGADVVNAVNGADQGVGAATSRLRPHRPGPVDRPAPPPEYRPAPAPDGASAVPVYTPPQTDDWSQPRHRQNEQNGRGR